MKQKYLNILLLIPLLLVYGCSKNNSSSDKCVTCTTDEKVDFDNFLQENEISEFIEEETQPTFNNAKWIWTNDNSNNTWVKLRKTIEISKVPNTLIAKLSVDSKYWLYINNEEVIFEGGLKRGPNKNDGYYDYIDIAPYLKEGKNIISVLAWYWGSKGSSYSNVSTYQAGFIFEASNEELYIISDSSWKVKRDNAYIQSNSLTESQPNYRLPEYNISYQANYETDKKWRESSFDDSLWESASVKGSYGDEPWNNLWKRPIPLIKNYGYFDYNNTNDYLNYTVKENERIIMKVGKNIQLCPYIKLNAPSNNLQIMISTETTISSQGDSVRTYYYTKEGEQEFTSLGFMNGQYVYYDLSKGVTINEIGYYKTGYDTNKVGSFNSEDDDFNRLWEMSYDTLYVTMRDNFMDCPNRERAQWMGDVTNEMEQIIYSMDYNSYLLYEKSIDQVLGFINNDVLPTVTPISNSWFELVVQNLCTISGVWTYYQYSGRSEIIRKSYPYFYNYLKLWSINEYGLVNHRTGSWDWMDNDAISPDTVVIENAWYYKALTALSNMAKLFNDEEVVNFAEERKMPIYDAFNDYLYTSKGYMDTNSVIQPDDRANAITVLAGLVPKENYETVINVLKYKKNSSPFWEKYVLEAMCEMGYVDEALKRMKSRYRTMLSYTLIDDEPYTTLWEKWEGGDGTKNHAWSGCPMTILSKYVLGVAPLSSNYNDFIVKPNYNTLTSVKGEVPTLKGQINVEFNFENERFNLKLKCPEDTKVILAIPYISKDKEIDINNQKIYSAGYIKNNDKYKYINCDENYIYFQVSGGEYSIKVF